MSVTDELESRDRYCDTCGSELEWETHFALKTPDEWLRFCGWECVTAYGEQSDDLVDGGS
jgi:hypothetical protein